MKHLLLASDTKEVQGCALYAEFTNDDGTQIYQMFITPDGVDSARNFVVATAYKRRLSTSAPKKQWRTTALTSNLVDPETGKVEQENNLSRLKHLSHTLDRLAKGRWTLVGEPFFVEVSIDDLTEVASGKTPLKVVYRITQTRKALGFAEMFAGK